jgi:septation ring formation regulator EzrA
MAAREVIYGEFAAEAAYFRAERRGFNGGDAVADWLEAEAEIDRRLRERAHQGLLEKLDERLTLSDGRLRAFKRKVSRMKKETREQWEQDVEKLAKLQDRLRKKVEWMRAQDGRAGEKVERQAEKIWAEMSDIVERVGARGKSRGAIAD